MGGWNSDYKLSNACDSSNGNGFLSRSRYGVNGADYTDFIFTFDDANTWCSGYRQFGGSSNGASRFTKDIEIYTGDANFGPWTKVATDSHSTWHNGVTNTFPDDGTTTEWTPTAPSKYLKVRTNTFTNDGTTTEWTPTAPSKYLKVRTLTNHGYTYQGGILTVRFLQLKFSAPPN